MTRTRILTCVLVALAVLLPCGVVEAQLGGLIKKKVDQATKGKEANKPAEGPAFAGDLVEITEPVLEGLLRGLRMEIVLRKAFKDELAKYPTPEQYQACTMQVAQSEEAQKLLLTLNMPDNATPEQAQRVMQKYSADLAALMKKQCPLDPAEWNPSKKAARLKEIEARAAEAAGSSEASPGEANPPGRGPSDAPTRYVSGPLSVTAYQLLKERIVAFCMSKLAAPGTDFSVSPVQFPGSGNNVYWVYTAGEARLLQARCKLLMDLTSQLLPA